MPSDLLWLLLALLGASLVRIGRRARSWPEALLGCALVLFGPGAGLLRAGIARELPAVGVTGLGLIALGSVALVFFTVLVFRPGEPRARAFAYALAAGLLLGFLYQLAHSGFGGSAARPTLPFSVARFLSCGWTAFEAVRYRNRYVKRLALGLADPVVANQFLLYAIWTGAFAVLPVVTLTLTLAGGSLGVSWRAVVMTPVRAVGLVALVSIYLTFLAPNAYVRWVERRHAARVGAGS